MAARPRPTPAPRTPPLCDRLQTCAPRRLTQVFGTLAICQSRLRLTIQSVLALPDIGWTAPVLTACASAQRTQTCTDFDDGKLPAACDVAGTRTNGRGCRGADQCASLRCSATGMGCGQCLARGGAGATCASDDDCQRAFICAVGTGGGSCVTPGSAGALCNATSAPCRYSLSCRSGTCATPGIGGAVCSDHEDCDDRNGWLCNGTTGRCGLASGGTTCNTSATDGTVQYCSDDGTCSATGACIPAAADNQACAVTGAACLPPATCMAGLCALPSTADCP